MLKTGLKDRKVKLAIISHTEHYFNDEGIVVGWGATIREINHLLDIFDEVYHLAPLHSGKAPNSALAYASDKIKFVPLKPSGGAGFKNKLKIVSVAKSNLETIHKFLPSMDAVQFRGPTNLGTYVIPYLTFSNQRKFWVKYAGNWSQENPPLSYAFQRKWLANNWQRSRVTVNGKWPNQPSHVVTFENPCISEEELKHAKAIATKKNYNGKLTFCFVGRIEAAKGVGRILDALALMTDTSFIKEFVFVGDGKARPAFEAQAQKLTVKCTFTGGLSREELNKVYEKAHVFCLPSTASEGFPKVIAEAAAFGCLPLVSSISSIAQYIHDEQNGIVVQNVQPANLANVLKHLAAKDRRKQLATMAHEAEKIAEKFTYEHYNRQLKKLILVDFEKS